MCKVEGCERESRYISRDVCQKHYFRFMRNGTYELTRRKPKPRYMLGGYVLVYKPGHALANKGGYVPEHRQVFYDANSEKKLKCGLCGKGWGWVGRENHVDHIDEDKLNNKLSNLRSLCNGCNTKRTKIDYQSLASNTSITWGGETKTAQEWGRDSRIPAKGHLIRQRLRRGLSVDDAFFMSKKTHKRTAEDYKEIEVMYKEKLKKLINNEG